jgi:hypothetical protein
MHQHGNIASFARREAHLDEFTSIHVIAPFFAIVCISLRCIHRGRDSVAHNQIAQMNSIQTHACHTTRGIGQLLANMHL